MIFHKTNSNPPPSLSTSFINKTTFAPLTGRWIRCCCLSHKTLFWLPWSREEINDRSGKEKYKLMITYGRCIKVSSVRCPHRIKYPKLSGSISPSTTISKLIHNHLKTLIADKFPPFLGWQRVSLLFVPHEMWQSWVAPQTIAWQETTDRPLLSLLLHLFTLLIISSRSLEWWWLLVSCNRSKWTIQSATNSRSSLKRIPPKELLFLWETNASARGRRRKTSPSCACNKTTS